MEIEKENIIDSKFHKKEKNRKNYIINLINSKFKHQKKLFFFFLLLIISINIIIIYLFHKNKKESDKKILNLEKAIKIIQERLENNLNKTTNLDFEINISNPIKIEDNQNNINENNSNNTNITGIELKEISYKEFDEKVLTKYDELQNEFCNNKLKYYNNIYESKIKTVNIDYLDKQFNMYIYNNEDIVSNRIKATKGWEKESTKNILSVLQSYSSIKKINNEDIYIVDIGANVGWYTFFLGKFGYKILSFEPSNLNIYILRNTYCLNREVKITLINKGLFTEEKNCDFYISRGNIGDGWIFCDKNTSIPSHLIKSGKTMITKLSNYASFLSEKNLVLIKIDVEGSEGKAIESGIELISKYHVPFIFLEFTPSSLKLHGTDPKEFLKIFEQNGYKISTNNFITKDYLSLDDIMLKANGGMPNLYITYSKIIEELSNN